MFLEMFKRFVGFLKIGGILQSTYYGEVPCVGVLAIYSSPINLPIL